MTNEIDIYRTANLLIETHGSLAARHASRRAADMLALGDLVARLTWLRVLRAVNELLDHRALWHGATIH